MTDRELIRRKSRWLKAAQATCVASCFAVLLLSSNELSGVALASLCPPVLESGAFVYMKQFTGDPAKCVETATTGPQAWASESKWRWESSVLLANSGLSNAPVITLANIIASSQSAAALTINSHGVDGAFMCETYVDYQPALDAMTVYIYGDYGFDTDDLTILAMPRTNGPDYSAIYIYPDGIATQFNNLAPRGMVAGMYCGSGGSVSAWLASANTVSYVAAASCQGCIVQEELWRRLTCRRYPDINETLSQAVNGSNKGPSLANYTTSGPNDNYVLEGESTWVMRCGVGCATSDAYFSEGGAFSDTAFCATQNEASVDSLFLHEYAVIAEYPDSGFVSAGLAAHGALDSTARYMASIAGSPQYLAWEARGIDGPSQFSLPFAILDKPAGWDSLYAAPIVPILPNALVEVTSEEVPATLEPEAAPTFADIIVYSVADSLAEPVRAQIQTDNPDKVVRKAFPDLTLPYPANSVEQVRAILRRAIQNNAARNDLCEPCTRYYPVNPGPEAYIVGGPSVILVPAFSWASPACGWQGCKSDLLLYDTDADGRPNGPLARIPAQNVSDVERATRYAQDWNRHVNVDASSRAVFLAGDLLHNGTSTVFEDVSGALDAAEDNFTAGGATSAGILTESDYVQCPPAPRRSALATVVNAGIAEIVGFGLFTGADYMPGGFIYRPNALHNYTRKQRMVAWWPGCNTHGIWAGITPLSVCAEAASGNPDSTLVARWMFGDSTKTTLAASVGGMDIGYDAQQRWMLGHLGWKRWEAGVSTNGMSLARLVYEAVNEAITDRPDWKDLALETSVFGSYVRIGGYTAGGGGCPFVDVRTPAGWRAENSILGRSLDGALLADGLALGSEASREGGRYAVRIRENEAEVTTLDDAKLVIVDRDSTERTFWTGRSFALGRRVPATQITSTRPGDLSALLEESGDGYKLTPGEILTIELPAPPAAPSRLSESGSTIATEGGGFDIESGGKEIDPGGEVAPGPPYRPDAVSDLRVLTETGLTIQYPDGQGGWVDRKRIYPRASFSEFSIDSIPGSIVRVVATGSHRIRFLGRFEQTRSPSPVVLSPASARHSRLGSVRTAIASPGGSSVQLAPGDTIGLEYAADPVPAGKRRDVFMLIRGVYTTYSPSSGNLIPAVQYAFSLGAARPNPSTGETTIDFTLARETQMSLRIYNVAGRLVRTLEQGLQSAGPHEIVWDGRDSGGRSVGAGVYFYRLVAESWSSKRKLVMLQR